LNRILITGGTGYIGSHTSVVLARLGYQVVLYDNLSNSSDSVVAKLEQITGQRIPFVRGDVRDTELVRHTLSSNQINAVIHFAGLKSVGESLEKPIDYYGNNVQGSISLVEAMQSQQVYTLVFSSSAAVYGHPQYLPLDENHPTITSNPYGRSKLHIEEMLEDIASADSRWRTACLRYFNPVGAHDSALIGETPNGLPNNLIPYMAQVASGERAELKVFGNDYSTPDGTGIRDYIHVMDLAEGHASALNFLATNSGCQIFNLGTGEGHSVFEMIKTFEDATGKKIPYRIEARRNGDVAISYSNPSHAQRLLKWSARRSLPEMCASTWKFQQTG
jgi:UDP-glucose 4-epimerase